MSYPRTRFSKKGTPVLYYAFLGDVIGAPYEFRYKNVFDTKFPLFKYTEKDYKHLFSDDSALTAYTALTIMQSVGKSDDEFIRNAVINLKKCVKEYPNRTFPGGYGKRFEEWAKTEGTEVMKNKSCGNGSAMRVSPAGWVCNTLEETLHVAEMTALPSHSDPEGIKGAQAIAAAVYLARNGVEKKDIKAYLETKFGYDLDTTLEEYRKYHRDELSNQSEVCPTTVPMAIRAFLDSDNYEDCIRKAVSIGGDSDTIGAMAGSIAGAFFGMPKWMETECDKRLDDNLKTIAKDFQKHISTIDIDPHMDELDNAMARARLEQYVLQQYKAGKEIVPKNDPKYLDLLVQMEATRLFCKEVNKAEREDDKQALIYDKDAFISQLKDKVKGSPELLEQYGKMETCPVEMVAVIDYDKAWRNEGVPKSIPDARPQVKHELIPNEIVTDDNLTTDLFAEGIKKAKDALKKHEQIAAQVDVVLAQQPIPDDESEKKTEVFYDAIIDEMVGENGEIGKCFSDGKIPELLKNTLADLKNMRMPANKYDPVKISDDALKKLERLSDELYREVTPQNSDEKVKQIAFVNRLAGVIDGWRDAPVDSMERDLINPSEMLSEKEAKRTVFGREINSDEMQAVKDKLAEVQKIYVSNKGKITKEFVSGLIELKLDAKRYMNERSNHNERYMAVQKVNDLTQRQLDSYNQLDVLTALSDELDNRKRTMFGNELNSDEMLKVKECLSNLKETMSNTSYKDQERTFMYDNQLNALKLSADRYLKSHSTHNDRYELVVAIRKAAQNQLEKINPAYREEKAEAKASGTSANNQAAKNDSGIGAKV